MKQKILMIICCVGLTFLFGWWLWSALVSGGIQSAGAPGAAIGLDPSGTLYADLSTATAANY